MIRGVVVLYKLALAGFALTRLVVGWHPHAPQP